MSLQKPSLYLYFYLCNFQNLTAFFNPYEFFIPSSPYSLPPSFPLFLLSDFPSFFPDGGSKWIIIFHWHFTVPQISVEVWDSSLFLQLFASHDLFLPLNISLPFFIVFLLVINMDMKVYFFSQSSIIY